MCSIPSPLEVTTLTLADSIMNYKLLVFAVFGNSKRFNFVETGVLNNTLATNMIVAVVRPSSFIEEGSVFINFTGGSSGTGSYLTTNCLYLSDTSMQLDTRISNRGLCIWGIR